jgi:hypothetical protein
MAPVSIDTTVNHLLPPNYAHQLGWDDRTHVSSVASVAGRREVEGT